MLSTAVVSLASEIDDAADLGLEIYNRIMDGLDFAGDDQFVDDVTSTLVEALAT